MRSDVSSLSGGLQQQQHELGVLQPRVSRLEALESSNPRASLRLVKALEGKLDNLAAQQVGDGGCGSEHGSAPQCVLSCSGPCDSLWRPTTGSRQRFRCGAADERTGHTALRSCVYVRPERLCCVCCMQARYSTSVEGVVGALVDDTVALNKTTRQVEGLVKHQQMQLQDTKEALLRWVNGLANIQEACLCIFAAAVMHTS